MQFWLLTGFMTLVFLTGGASRVDPLSLALLRPVSVFVSVVALLTLRRDHWQGRKSLAIIMAALFGLALLHVVPLPTAIWQSLPGRAEIAEIDALGGLDDVWRPLTLTPMNGWHAINSLFVPLAVLLLGVQLSREELLGMIPVLIGLGIVSALIGIVQIVGGANSPAYLYRITNNGSAVGLFANRNHAALMLAMILPLLATYVTTTRAASGQVELRKISAFAVALVVLPLILVTGSRAGLVFAVVGVGSMFLLYRPVAVRALRRGENSMRLVSFPVLGGMAVLLTAVSTILLSRAESIERVFGETAVEDARVDYWAVALDLVWKYFPVGSGSGSFAEVYQIVEPDYLLNFSFLNHAHNDWLETAVTFGLPGIILLVATALSFARRSLAVWFAASTSGRSNELARLATILLLMAAIGSFADYPLRTPIMMAVAALSALWLFTDRIPLNAYDKNFGKGG
jgi:O-antigen ligase